MKSKKLILLTQSQYSRHRKENCLSGTTPSAVGFALKSGRISFSSADSKLIDPEQADRQWVSNTDARPSLAKGSGSRNPQADQDYNASRAKREFYESELARLKVERERGKLVSADTVRKVMYEAGRIILAGCDDILAQLAPDLAPQMPIDAVERILKTRLHRLCKDFSDRIGKIDTNFADHIEKIDNNA